MNIAVLISGNGSNLQALLDSAVRPGIQLVLSNRSGVRALERAEKAGCAYEVLLKSEFSDLDSYDRHLAERLNELKIDLVVLAGWMHILGPQYLHHFQGRTINLHPALPGCYPGTHAIQRAWDDRVKESGCMVHDVIEEVDAGEVLDIERLQLSEYQTLTEFEDAVHKAEHRLLVRVVTNLYEQSIELSKIS